MKIEKLSIHNYEDVLLLWKKTGISVDSSDTKDEMERMIQLNSDLLLIGKIEEKIIGVVMGGFDGRRGYIHHLAIDPEYQKKGYGKLLMEELIKQYRKKRVHKIHLFIEKRNKDVIQFYSKLDWELRKDLIMMSYIPDEKLYKSKI